MQCPYCLSEVSDAAVVCKTCSRDLYLFKPLLEKISALETKVQALEAEQSLAQQPIAQQIEEILDIEEGSLKKARGRLLLALQDIFYFLLVPLALLLLSHAFITVVYDLKLIYLRLISITLPLPFGFFLVRQTQRNLLVWFLGVAVLAVASVIGMSAITAMVDEIPIWPQNAFEWRETIEYAASISFSFLTGMLLTRVGEGMISAENLQILTKNVKAFGGTIAALLTTCLSIYTGLNDVFK